MLQKSTFFLTFFFITSIHAKVVNSGGGGPDAHGETKKKDKLNPNLKEQMIEKVTQKNAVLMDEIKNSWRECYVTKLMANNLIDLYAQLTIHNAGQGPKVRKKYVKEFGQEGCEKSKVFSCFLKNGDIQNHIYSMIQNESLHYYLESKGIDKSESREQLIKFYADLLKGIANE